MTSATPQLEAAARDALDLLTRIAEGKEWGAIEEYIDALTAALSLPAQAPAEARELAERLTELARGTVEWRVADPETGSYCIHFDNHREAAEWLEDHRLRFPDSMHANKVVRRVVWFSELERAAIEAASRLASDAPAAAPAGDRTAQQVEGDAK